MSESTSASQPIVERQRRWFTRQKDASPSTASTQQISDQPTSSTDSNNTNGSGGSWFSSLLARRSPSPIPPLPNPPPAVAVVTPTISSAANPSQSTHTSTTTASATSKLDQLSAKLRKVRDQVDQLAHPHPSVNDMIVPPFIPWPTAPSTMTSVSEKSNGTSTSGVAGDKVAGTSTSSSSQLSSVPAPPSISSLPSPTALVVSISTLNLYSDLSEVSGLVLCPGFTRLKNNTAGPSTPNDPVPSHQHPESISPTILPPLPSVEERKLAMEQANLLQQQDQEKEQKREIKEVEQQHDTLADSSNSTKKPTTSSLAEMDQTSSANSPVAPAAPVTSSTSWLSNLLKRPGTIVGASTALDSVSSVAPATVSSAITEADSAAIHTADVDSEHDLIDGPTSKAKKRSLINTLTKPTITAPAHTQEEVAIKRANQARKQIWLFGSNPPESATEKEKMEQQPTTLTTPAAATTPAAKTSAVPTTAVSVPPATAAAAATVPTSSPPSVPAGSVAGAPVPVTPAVTTSINPPQPAPSMPSSSLGSFLRSGIQSASSLASSALYWTLGPFDPHTPEIAPVKPQEPVIPLPSKVAAPPTPPPVWSTLRKVVIIGVHGWSLMGGMLGEKPIVVSHKFCQMAQRALAGFMKEKGVALDQVQVCTIPLHGHGKVEQRVEAYLQQQLPQFKPYITTADAIFVIAHSQGVLVSVSLLHQLILQGWIDPRKQHVSMQLMAGLHHGPFPDLLWDLYAATKELFSYCYVDSEVHRRYMQALHYLLENSVKILCIGSIHDQAVPLYSALIQSFPSCPNLLRGIYIDYSTYQPDFMHALLSLVVYLMNTGVHGGRRSPSTSTSPQQPNDDAAHAVYVEALVHISGWLRGGLLEKNGGAHSAIHRLTDCYNLGMEWSLCGRGVETSVHVHSHSFAAWAPYFQESFTHTKMNRYMMVLRFRELFSLLPSTQLDSKQELIRLYQLYTSWQPRSKQLRQLKEAFAPLFEVPGVVPSVEDVKVERVKGKSEKDAGTAVGQSDSVSSSAAATPPPPLSAQIEQALLSLLTPPRLPILPVTLPSSWQMNAENAQSLSSSLSESPPIQQGEKPIREHRHGRNRRLRHVKEVPEEEMMALAVEDHPKQPQPAMPDLHDDAFARKLSGPLLPAKL